MSELDSQSLANLDANSRKEIMEWIESENAKSKVQMCKSDFSLNVAGDLKKYPLILT